MRLLVRVVPAAGDAPPDGTPITIEIRDVSDLDAASVMITHVETVVGATTTEAASGCDDDAPTPPTDLPAALAVSEIEVDDELLSSGRELNVWARVDVSGQPRVSAGDWITTQAYPVRAATEAVDVEVRPV